MKYSIKAAHIDVNVNVDADADMDVGVDICKETIRFLSMQEVTDRLFSICLPPDWESPWLDRVEMRRLQFGAHHAHLFLAATEGAHSVSRNEWVL